MSEFFPNPPDEMVLAALFGLPFGGLAAFRPRTAFGLMAGYSFVILVVRFCYVNL